MKQFEYYYIIIVAFSTIISFAQPANILGIFPLTSKSHYVMFERLFKALAEKGHEVDIAGHFPLENPPSRYNDISLKGTVPSAVNTFTVDDMSKFSVKNMLFMILKENGGDLCQTILNSNAMKELKSSTKKYDLVITEIFGSDCMLGFGHHFSAPVISVTTSVDLPWGGVRAGNPDHPGYIPTYFVEYTSRMTLYERTVNTLNLVLSKLAYKYLSNIDSNRIAKNFFGSDLPDLEILAQNTSLILVNSHFSMNMARPTVPNFVEVGGLHIKEPKPLNQYFQKLLSINGSNSTIKGIIYFSMGSLVRSDSFDKNKLQAMFDAFAKIPYKVLWKTNIDTLPKGLVFPENIHFEKWFPQQDILCHPNVVLFVSHGGLMGSQEAVLCAVPRLGIPLFGDQRNNIRQSEKMETAIAVDYNDITKETIKQALEKLLENSKYRENAKKMSDIFKDRPLSSLDTAIYWVEYVIRHKGALHLRSAAADLTWYQYYLLDVVTVLLSISYILVRIFVLLFKFIINNLLRAKSKAD